MQSLHSAITPAHLPFLARSPPWSPLLHLPCTRPSTTPPILQLSDFPTSRKVEKPTNRKVGKLAPTTGRGSTTPPNAAKTSHLPPLRPLSFTLHHTCPFPSLLLPPGKPPLPLPHLILHPCTRQASRIVVSSSHPPAPRSPTCPLSLPAGRPPPVPPTPTRPPAVTRLNPPHPVIARLRSPPPNPAHSVITPPGLPFLRARTYRPPAAPRHRANSPTSQQIDKSKSRKVGKLAHTTNPQGRGNPPRNAAKTSRPLPPRIVHTSSHPRPALALPRR